MKCRNPSIGLLRVALLSCAYAGLTASSPHQVSDSLALGASAPYQGAQASDAFSAIHWVGSGRVIAGRRSSTACNRFLLSRDDGVTWSLPPARPGQSASAWARQMILTGDVFAGCQPDSPILRWTAR